jgi:hypothetical protein
MNAMLGREVEERKQRLATLIKNSTAAPYLASMRCCRSSIAEWSTGDFQEALAALVGKDAPNLSLAVISRQREWQADYDAWQKRDLLARRYVYVWADRVYLQARMENNSECMLVLIGATPEGKRNLSAFRPGPARARRAGVSCSSTSSSVGSRSRRTSRSATVRSASGGRSRRLSRYPAPTLLDPKDGQRAEQGCALVQVNMKADLREIYGAPTRAAAEVAIGVFAE